MENDKTMIQPENTVSTKDILKASVKNMFKNHKKLVKAIIALVVILAVFIAGIGVLSVRSVQMALINSFIPDQITSDELGITFYSEPNPEYNETKAVLPYRCYYYENNDTSGEKIYLQNGVYKNGAEKVYVAAGFGLELLGSINKASTVLKWIAAVVAVAVVVLLIVAWYNSFKKQELAKKDTYRKSHPRH